MAAVVCLFSVPSCQLWPKCARQSAQLKVSNVFAIVESVRSSDTKAWMPLLAVEYQETLNIRTNWVSNIAISRKQDKRIIVLAGEYFPAAVPGKHLRQAQVNIKAEKTLLEPHFNALQSIEISLWFHVSALWMPHETFRFICDECCCQFSYVFQPIRLDAFCAIKLFGMILPLFAWPRNGASERDLSSAYIAEYKYMYLLVI